MTVTSSVDNDETVVRILHKDWVVDGKLQITAFALRQAGLDVSAVRNIKVDLGQLSADLSVEVEPRDAHYKSHAGIFTRYDEKIIKGGQETIRDKNDCLMPVRAIFQKVQHQLLAFAILEQHEISLSK